MRLCRSRRVTHSSTVRGFAGSCTRRRLRFGWFPASPHVLQAPPVHDAGLVRHGLAAAERAQCDALRGARRPLCDDRRQGPLARARSCVLALALAAKIRSRSLLFARACSCLLALALVCSRSLVFARARSCLLALARVCSRSLLFARAHPALTC